MNIIHRFNRLLNCFHDKDTPQFQRFLVIYCVIATLVLYSFLFLPIIGAEGNYTMSTMEMAYSHQYVNTTVFGMFYGRPPLVNWLMLSLTKLLGWSHILLVSRFIVISFSIGLAIVLGFFVKRFTDNECFAWLCVAILLSGDLLLRRGWLAYSDTHLAFFTFSAMACLWLGLDKRKVGIMVFGLGLLNCGYLSKALTPFGYYAIFYLVLFWRHPNRRFLLHPLVILLHLIAFSFPFIWDHYTSKQYGGMMLHDVFNLNHTPGDIANYFYQILFYRPVELILHLAPASIIALGCLIVQRPTQQTWQAFKPFMLITFFTGIIIFAGCWLMPLWPEARYYLPAYPLFAIVLAYVIWHAGKTAQQLLQLCLIINIIVALFLSLWGIRFFQEHARFYYPSMAQQIMRITEGYPLYALNPQVSESESIVSILDSQRLPTLPPVLLPPANWNNGFAVTTYYQPDRGQIVVRYTNGIKRNHVYLLCRGTTCEIAAQRLNHALPIEVSNRQLWQHSVK